MRPNPKHFLAMFAVSCLLSGALITTAAVAADQTAPTDKVAVVNGSVITRMQLDQNVARLSKMQGAQDKPLEGEQLKQLQDKALDALIRNELLYQASQKAGVKIEDSVINEQIDTLKKRFSSEDDFKKALAQIGATEDALRQQLREQLSIRKYVEEAFSPKATVSDAEVKTFYDQHPVYFKVPEQVKASHILVKVEDKNNAAQKAAALEKIKKAQQRLKNGEDFATVAKEMSEGPSSSKGGELGYFSRGQMVKPFEDAAFGLKPGEVSDIVETQFGYHLIKVEDKKPEGKVDFEEAKPKIEQYLKRQKLTELVNQQVSEMEKTAKIEKFLK
jgi:peptidyl-prolyl cis-trans isomerase C